MSQSGSLPVKKLPLLDPLSNESGSAQWKQEVNERLAAHRSRRSDAQGQLGNDMSAHPRTASARAAEAAARVAARYAKAPSYSELLAGEARKAVHVARVAAEAARNAKAAAEAVLAGLESGLNPDRATAHVWEHDEPASAIEKDGSADRPAHASRWQDEPLAGSDLPETPSQDGAQKNTRWAGAQPRWEETLPPFRAQSGRDVWSEMRVTPAERQVNHFDSEKVSMRRYDRDLLEGELFPDDPYYVHDPMASATVEPVQHIPANLIEFPRELVATRKARPRLAEGPLYDASHESPQLSIFEVDPDSLTSPVYPADTATEKVAPPEWASIELDHYREARTSEARAELHSYAEHSYVAPTEIPVGYAVGTHASATSAAVLEEEAPIQVAEVREEPIPHRESVASPLAPVPDLLVAQLSDRLLSAVIDGALVTLAFLAAAVVVIASTTHPPTGRLAIVACGCGWLLFGLLYQFLFLSYAEEGTPGMRYARIALCTFDDDNPTVEQMRNRIPALLLSALPASLGLVWTVFDKDHLGWHDRMTKTYQRKY